MIFGGNAFKEFERNIFYFALKDFVDAIFFLRLTGVFVRFDVLTANRFFLLFAVSILKKIAILRYRGPTSKIWRYLARD